jgi:glycosyltransferase involved in cell wall biosynthesis
MTRTPSVVHVIPDKMGGALTIVANLLTHRQPDRFEHRLVLTCNRLHPDTRSSLSIPADRSALLEYTLPIENLSSVLRRLAAAIGPGPGVLVCHDHLELLLAASQPLDRAVVQVLHGDYDYYYNLAVDHDAYVHAFVAYSRTVFEQLRTKLPHRRDDIFWLPYGIPMTADRRTPSAGPLRAIFAGRVDEAKGVFDLAAIDRILRSRGVGVRWTILGDGPARDTLQSRLPPSEHVRYAVVSTPAAARAIVAQHDVFVLPSRGEGLSVAAVEAMCAGVVPIVSDLRSLSELADNQSTGLRAPVGDVAAFAALIERLDRNREALEAMSATASAFARSRYDIASRSAAYQSLFAQAEDLRWRRPIVGARAVGSRLDRPWIPNTLVRLVRTALRQAR